jgi:predicted nuclease of predicted toxin-antitoxin system
MNILVDENIPNLTVSTLRSRGDNVLDIRGTPTQGIFDDGLWNIAQKDRRIFITTDKGFVSHRNDAHFGILVIRLRQPNEARIHASIMTALRDFPTQEDWIGLLVVMRDKVRSVFRSG